MWGSDDDDAAGDPPTLGDFGRPRARAVDPRASAAEASATEEIVLTLVLSLVGRGTTMSGLRSRLRLLDVDIGEPRLSQVLVALDGRGLLRPSGTGRFVATAAGHAYAAAAAARLSINAERGELERLRTRLLGVIGHELRTPLTAIRNAVGLLQDEQVAPAPAERALLLASIADAARRLQDLTSDVLELARLRGGEVSLQLRMFDAERLVNDVCGIVAPRIHAKDQRLHRIIDARPTLIGDRARIRRALVKLLTNASDFAPTGATIRVRLAAIDDEVLWAVADPGRGIAADELPSLFERFLATEPSAAPTGAGLGLPIARAIAQAHGGTIDVATKLGTGSTFTLRLPIDGPEESET